MPDRDVVQLEQPRTDPAPSPGPADRLPCSHCRTDITFLPPGARFCSHCGLPLAKTSARHTPAPPAPGSWRTWWWGGAPRTQESEPRDRSGMLLAYAKSMFSLGWRYEHSVGARRNLGEAARCYWKAARLGNPSAAERLRNERLGDLGNPPAPHPRTPGLAAPAPPPPLAAIYSPPPPSPPS